MSDTSIFLFIYKTHASFIRQSIKLLPKRLIIVTQPRLELINRLYCLLTVSQTYKNKCIGFTSQYLGDY